MCLLKVLEYLTLTKEAMTTPVLMPTTYLSEKGFSTPVDDRTKKRNCFLDVDTLVRLALKEITLPWDKLIHETQQQKSH
ncbi:putative protein FAM200A-like [Homarus americanus]|uniref:Uncharacterized protein n=1 Tax=Homarus americanus TaxID=6706 RepID=A0A8J5JWV4_HOMAM|nr:putative protein FAM200A-like [Homarus americanus]